MTDSATIAITGHGLCVPDEDLAAELGFADAGLDASILPAMVRRRTSMATRAAITAASRACTAAETEPTLPAIFISAAGEMQITDKLCRAITRQAFPLSPTQFHNSVHNTAAGYWSIATGSMASMQAMGALDDGFALALLEAWCQLQTVSERVLLVVYDEAMPEQLLPDYDWQTCAFALLLARDAVDCARLQRPRQPVTADPAGTGIPFPARNPAMAALPLFQALQQPRSGAQDISLSCGPQPWVAELTQP